MNNNIMWNQIEETTKKSINKLNDFFSKNVLTQEPDNKFVCKYSKTDSKNNCFKNCKNPNIVYRKAVLPHVGKRYDLSINGIPMRILIVGLETLDEELYSISKRTCQIINGAANEPFYKKGDNIQRNPHMRGVSLVLKILLNTGDTECRYKETDEFYRDEHIFNYFAMTNMFLCGRFLNKKRAPIKSMEKNCVEHLEKIINILKPSIIVFLGLNTKFAIDNLWNYETKDRKEIIIPSKSKTCNFLPKVVIRLKHPSRCWSTHNYQYYKESVLPIFSSSRKYLYSDSN